MQGEEERTTEEVNYMKERSCTNLLQVGFDLAWDERVVDDG